MPSRRCTALSSCPSFAAAQTKNAPTRTNGENTIRSTITTRATFMQSFFPKRPLLRWRDVLVVPEDVVRVVPPLQRLEPFELRVAKRLADAHQRFGIAGVVQVAAPGKRLGLQQRCELAAGDDHPLVLGGIIPPGDHRDVEPRATGWKRTGVLGEPRPYAMNGLDQQAQDGRCEPIRYELVNDVVR